MRIGHLYRAGGGGGGGAEACGDCQDRGARGKLVFRAAPSNSKGVPMSIKCQCGREREAAKRDVIKLLEGGTGPSEIARIIGCSRQYVQQLQHELAIAKVTASQMRIDFRIPFQSEHN